MSQNKGIPPASMSLQSLEWPKYSDYSFSALQESPWQSSWHKPHGSNIAQLRITSYCDGPPARCFDHKKGKNVFHTLILDALCILWIPLNVRNQVKISFGWWTGPQRLYGFSFRHLENYTSGSDFALIYQMAANGNLWKFHLNAPDNIFQVLIVSLVSKYYRGGHISKTPDVSKRTFSLWHIGGFRVVWPSKPLSLYMAMINLYFISSKHLHIEIAKLFLFSSKRMIYQTMVPEPDISSVAGAATSELRVRKLLTYCWADSLQWRHNGGDSVSNHHPHDCLLNGLFRGRSKKTSKLRVPGLCADRWIFRTNGQ